MKTIKMSSSGTAIATKSDVLSWSVKGFRAISENPGKFFPATTNKATAFGLL